MDDNTSMDALGKQLAQTAHALANTEDPMLWGARIVSFLRAWELAARDLTDNAIRPAGCPTFVDLAIYRLLALVFTRAVTGRW